MPTSARNLLPKSPSSWHASLANSRSRMRINASHCYVGCDARCAYAVWSEMKVKPGGGPFWSLDGEGNTTPQIVEMVEVDPNSPPQQAIIQKATHFNPVFIALSVRDSDSIPYDLQRYVDQQRTMIASKPVAGGDATVLERPGLWNGAMAGMNSVFVEIPGDVFSPVKSVLDLLRPQHQP